MHWVANVGICLTFKSGAAGIWLATVLLYLYILNLGHTWAVRKSASDMVLRTQEIKAKVKECKMKNLVTTWIGPAVREKQRTADSRSTLFTFMKRSDWKCRSRDLPPACENKVNKMILCEVNMYL